MALGFDDTPGELIGARGDGFKNMLLLMNNARVGVGFESLGVCEAAWRQAKAFAAERPSMGKTIDKHEMIAEHLERMETTIQGLRALAMRAAHHEEMSQKLRLRLQFDPPEDRSELERLQREQRRHQSTGRRLTPLLKYLGSEAAVDLARTNVQVHGGAGYVTEYDAEKLLRDALVFPIYEGTSQIQALLATKDVLLGTIGKPQAFVQAHRHGRVAQPHRAQPPRPSRRRPLHAPLRRPAAPGDAHRRRQVPRPPGAARHLVERGSQRLGPEA